MIIKKQGTNDIMKMNVKIWQQGICIQAWNQIKGVKHEPNPI